MDRQETRHLSNKQLIRMETQIKSRIMTRLQGNKTIMQNLSTKQLVALDHAHVWHPFTPMKQWRESDPMIIESGDGDFLIDTEGNRYIDGVSSLWCNVHGHRVKKLDDAVRDQLDRIAHTTMLGLSNPAAIELAARLCEIAPGGLNKVFYSDSGATALEVAFKMAVGYWYHTGHPDKTRFIAIGGAYHGDTVGSMSVGYSDTFHRPFKSLVFHTDFVQPPDVFHSGLWQVKFRAKSADAPNLATDRVWALEDPETATQIRDQALNQLDHHLTEQGSVTAAIVVEPLVQGAAGIVVHPEGYLSGVADLAKKHGVLLIADEVAVGFGRTGRMFACEHEDVEPDILCLAKGITGGYLPLAATIATDQVEQAFVGEIAEHRTLYHGHTYTGNPLACAAALASLALFQEGDLINEVNRKAAFVTARLDALRDGDAFPNVGDVRQRGLMVGIELVDSTPSGTGFDPSRRLGYEVCAACRDKGLIIRPLGNVIVLMPPPGIENENLARMLDIVIETIREFA